MGNLGRATSRSKRKPKGAKRARSVEYARQLQQEDPDPPFESDDGEPGSVSP
jgi:hypothetical protein